jgi:hypothetical protein
VRAGVGGGVGVLAPLPPPGPLREEDYFYLHDTHGIPRSLVDGLLA